MLDHSAAPRPFPDEKLWNEHLRDPQHEFQKFVEHSNAQVQGNHVGGKDAGWAVGLEEGEEMGVSHWRSTCNKRRAAGAARDWCCGALRVGVVDHMDKEARLRVVGCWGVGVCWCGGGRIEGRRLRVQRALVQWSTQYPTRH